ncbi:hypothetical protein DRI50_00005 [candidate division KSB1 bacterium]|nr:MAG: hypothetical protein DRI50_00005 [candidate division KSB1 bacterium]
MFQETINTTPDLSSILNQELDSFTSVLQFSEKIIEQIDTLPISALSQMVEYRQKWIDQIQELEAFRKKIGDKAVGENERLIIQNISKLARKLVEIDEQIYRQLQSRKLKFVKQHADLIAARRQNKTSNGLSNRMDIIQE